MTAHVASSGIAGNGLFASSSVSAGDAVLTVERPLITALDQKRLASHCSNCFSEANDEVVAKACQGCKTVYYCSKSCQTHSWKREHKNECKILGRFASDGKSLPNAARAVLQMMRLSSPWESSPLKNMKSHLNEIVRRGGDRGETLHVLSLGIHAYTGTKLPIEVVQHCFALVFTNSLTLWTPTFDALGICLDPLAAAANHSCEPNAITVFDGPRLAFRALRPIAKNEEILISYIDGTQPFSIRQRELSERFYFDCSCSKCKLRTNTMHDRFVETSSPSRETDKLLISVEKHASEAVHIASRTTQAEAIVGLRKALSDMIRTDAWPEHRQPMPALRKEAFVQLLAPGSYVAAIFQGLKMYFDSDPLLYEQPFHPIKVVHKWTLATLCIYLSSHQEEPGVDYLLSNGVDLAIVVWGLLVEVDANVKQSHGSTSSFAGKVKSKVEEVRADMARGGWSVDVTPDMQRNIQEQWVILRRLTNCRHTNALETPSIETN